jgi:predicted peptidase
MLHALTLLLLAFQDTDANMNDAAKLYEAKSIRISAGESDGQELKYRLLKPAKIEEGKKYPLVVFLHGAGERGDDNKAQLKYFPTMMVKAEYREKYPCFILAPQCPNGKSWAGFGRRRGKSAESDQPTDELTAVMKAVEQTVKENQVDTSRLYLTGLSMGGFGSWDWVAREPDRFAAVVPICGGGDPTEADRLTKTPIWAVHGDADPVVPVDQTRRMIEAIKKAGGEPKYSELKGVEHNSWTPAYNERDGVVKWMFEQKKG